MIRVNLMEKKIEGDETKRFAVKTIELPQPKNYNDFITEIGNKFNIKRKKDIQLKCITNDNEDYAINNQDDLDDNIDDIKEFEVYSESGFEEPKKPKEKPSTNTNTIKDKDSPKKDEEPKEEDGDDDEYKINLDVNIDIKDEEIEKIITSQIKEISIDEDINDDIEFDSDKYKEDLKKNTDNIIQKFQNEFNIKIKDIYAQKTTALITDFKNKMDDYSKSQINIINKIGSDANTLNDGFGNMVNDTEEMISYMGKLKRNMEGNSNLDFSEITIKKPDMKNDPFSGGNFIVDEDDENDNNKRNKNNNNNNKKNNKLVVKFIKEVIEIEALNTKCEYIMVDNVKIENIGDAVLKNLYLIRDEEHSSPNFVINQTKKTNSHKLTPCEDEFGPQITETHSITLKIKNPEPEKKYTLFLYVRQTENGENLSKPLKIICTVNEDEEAKIRQQEKEEQERLKKQQQEKEEQERLKKQQQEKEEQERLKQEQIKKQQQQQQQQKQNNDSNNDDNFDFKGLNKDDVIRLAEELHEEFNLFSIRNREEVIKKIIEVQCNREEMDKWIEEVL